MAGIYIKGMEMPGSCEDCKLFNMEYNACNYTNCSVGYEYSNKRMDDCPIVPVPSHGGLIDRDELNKSLIDEEETISIDGFSINGLTADDVCYSIENAPVVIPAERSEE